MKEHQSAGFISIGRISSAHGIKGALNVRPYGADDLFASYPYLYLKEEQGGFSRFAVSSCRQKKPGSFILKLEGVDDRNRAEALSGSELFVTRDMLPETGPDEDYWQDIIGLQVVLSDGTPVGRIANIMETPGHDIYVVKAESGKEILVPAVKEIVTDIDLDSKTCTIDPPPGLIDANAPNKP